DFLEETRFDVPAIVTSHHLRSSLSVPMMRDGEVVGAMVVHARDPNFFTDADAGPLSMAANDTAIAIQSASRYKTGGRGRRHSRAISELAKQLTQRLTATLEDPGSSRRRQILDRILQGAAMVLNSDESKAARITLQTFDATQDALSLESVHPREDFQP